MFHIFPFQNRVSSTTIASILFPKSIFVWKLNLKLWGVGTTPWFGFHTFHHIIWPFYSNYIQSSCFRTNLPLDHSHFNIPSSFYPSLNLLFSKLIFSSKLIFFFRYQDHLINSIKHCEKKLVCWRLMGIEWWLGMVVIKVIGVTSSNLSQSSLSSPPCDPHFNPLLSFIDPWPLIPQKF